MHNKRWLLLIGYWLLLLALPVDVWAVPAYTASTMTVRGRGGQMLTVMLCGDETFHYYTTTDGTPVRMQADGTWDVDTRDVVALWRKASRERNVQRLQLAQRMRKVMKAPRRIGSSTATAGQKRGLLILVNFLDVKMQEASTQETFEQMMNGLDNPYGKNKGSVREYFRAQSYGQFDVEFDVVGPIELPDSMKHYGANVNGNDGHAGLMVDQACRLVDDEVDFTQYDWDGDGEVENIYVTYAGYGENYVGVDSCAIWPHQWDVTSAFEYNEGQKDYKLELDGVRINTYACGAELYGNAGTTISGIGTMCHEYSHCLGLPDFYDVKYLGHPHMLGWSLMASGCYNYGGFCPSGYTAYERWFSGWLEPEELNEPATIINMKPIEDEPVAYVVYNDSNRNEYYLLANHQQKGWDTKAAGHGLMVLHVDYDENAWNKNKVNNISDHQRMIVIPADSNGFAVNSNGKYISSGSDLWPGTSGQTALTDNSVPPASLYTPNTDNSYLMHKPIEHIAEADGLISFRFMGGAPPVRGDLDGDGQVTIADLTTLINILLGKE